MSEPENESTWATDLVSKWCSKRADDMAALIDRCRKAYRTGPMVEPVNQFADILERHQTEWREAAKKFLEQKTPVERGPE